MASNKYGLPRPDMLDLTFCNVWINAPRGYEAHYDYDYRVIAVIQPINMLLIRKYKVLKEYKNGVRNEATDEYRLVKIYDIDINDHRVIYNDPEGCGWNDSLYSLVPVNSPWCSYLECQKQYKWQEEEEE